MPPLLQMLRDGPYTLLTLEAGGVWDNSLLCAGRSIADWHSEEPPTFEAYAECWGLGRFVAPLFPCPTCAGFADCDGGHD